MQGPSRRQVGHRSPLSQLIFNEVVHFTPQAQFFNVVLDEGMVHGRITGPLAGGWGSVGSRRPPCGVLSVASRSMPSFSLSSAPTSAAAGPAGAAALFPALLLRREGPFFGVAGGPLGVAGGVVNVLFRSLGWPCESSL